jgi:hypothetical protein
MITEGRHCLCLCDFSLKSKIIFGSGLRARRPRV